MLVLQNTIESCIKDRTLKILLSDANLVLTCLGLGYMRIATVNTNNILFNRYNFEIPDFPLDIQIDNIEAPKLTDKNNGAFSDLGYFELEKHSNTTKITSIDSKMTEEEYHNKFSYSF